MEYDVELTEKLFIREITEKYDTDLRQRIFDFAVASLKMLMKL